MSSVDIVYVVGEGAKDINDAPLRWSLRSLEMHASGVGRIIVSGYPPEWLSECVINVPIDNVEGMGKNSSIGLAAIAGAKRAGIKGMFLYSSDDHYLIKNSDMRIWPRYYTGAVDVFIGAPWFKRGSRSCREYWSMLKKCEDYLSSIGLPSWRKACLHVNTWMDADMIIDAERIILEAGKSGIEIEPTQLFNALFEKEVSYGRFVKYSGDMDHKATCVAGCMHKDLSKAVMFSTNDTAERDPKVVEWMERRFPNKSKWEK